KIAGVADIDGIALPVFDGGGDGLSPDGSFDDLVNVADGEAVARRGLAVRGDIQKVTAGGALGENAAGVREIAQGLFDLNAYILNHAKIGAEDFDHENRAKASSEHTSARLTGHQ